MRKGLDAAKAAFKRRLQARTGELAKCSGISDETHQPLGWQMRNTTCAVLEVPIMLMMSLLVSALPHAVSGQWKWISRAPESTGRLPANVLTCALNLFLQARQQVSMSSGDSHAALREVVRVLRKSVAARWYQLLLQY